MEAPDGLTFYELTHKIFWSIATWLIETGGPSTTLVSPSRLWFRRLVRNLIFARVVRSCESLDTLWLTAPSDRVSDDLGPVTALVTVLYILGFLVLEAKMLAVVERLSSSWPAGRGPVASDWTLGSLGTLDSRCRRLSHRGSSPQATEARSPNRRWRSTPSASSCARTSRSLTSCGRRCPGSSTLPCTSASDFVVLADT